MQLLFQALNSFWGGFLTGTACIALLMLTYCARISARNKRAIDHWMVKSENLETSNQALRTKLAVAGEKIAQIPHLEQDFKTAMTQYESSREALTQEIARRARAEQQATRIVDLETNLAASQSTIESLHHGMAEHKTTNVELQTRMEEERKNADEKLQLIKSAENQLIHQFESLATKILTEKSKAFTKENKINLENVLSPLRNQLGDFKKKVDDVYISDVKDRASLREAIRNLHQENQRITQEANNLTRALKGDKKAQGNWGELVLERVLEQSGLRKGVEYDAQDAHRNADNRLLKPDIIVHLPEAKDVVIDSKVSLVAYEAYSSAEKEEIQSKALTEHVQAVRNHIKGLSEKDYSNMMGLRSLDFVLMFMPIEAAFMAAFQHDDKLFSDAFQHNIIVVTPTTLLATLRTIENIWRYERQNDNAKVIAGKAAMIYDKLRGFVEDLEKLGTQISTVQNTYDGVMNKLTRGKGNLVRQASTFVELGVNVKKPLPKSIIEKSDGNRQAKTSDEDASNSAPSVKLTKNGV